jgi:hypothetical protein
VKASCLGAGAAGGVNVCFGFGAAFFAAGFFAAGSLAGVAGGVNGAVVVVGAAVVVSVDV